jgi:hypothetical protein
MYQYLTQTENTVCEWIPKRILPDDGTMIIAFSSVGGGTPLVAMGRFRNYGGFTPVQYLDEFFFNKKGEQRTRRWEWSSFELWTELPQ